MGSRVVRIRPFSEAFGDIEEGVQADALLGQSVDVRRVLVGNRFVINAWIQRTVSADTPIAKVIGEDHHKIRRLLRTECMTTCKIPRYYESNC